MDKKVECLFNVMLLQRDDRLEGSILELKWLLKVIV